MRIILAGWIVLSLFTVAGETAAQRTNQDGDSAEANEGVYGDSCIGDRYESDNDVNEGNRITDEEILRILHLPSSWPPSS
ncbi:MAG: hypothetical protein HOI19_18550 [Rhodospirillaceae bacterium]|jgi:hypothetical protein|nr:hypothetical protein [Rhodospirillaceae bacterium]